MLLRAVIERDASLVSAIETGDCKVIAATVNGYMPADLQITPVDVYQALKDRPGFRLPTLNAEILRDRIDKMPTLYSARINNDAQCILNELHIAGDPVSLIDVEVAMTVRALPKPDRIIQGSAAMAGISRLG